MKIYTKTGDGGKTSLYDSNRIDKDSIRVEAYGTIDELNSYLGLARSFCEDDEIKSILFDIQRKLFDVAGELATMDVQKFPERIDENQVIKLEEIIDNYLLKMNKDEAFKFIIPGSNKSSATLHVARTICRRAERRILTLSKTDKISSLLIKYINRLSDVIYTLARFLETKLDYVEFKK
ncbi:cob(I)yrinic acid a,c-diamide adenosyltransferase [Peptostreptococcaceae bacterium AGR-M142]